MSMIRKKKPADGTCCSRHTRSDSSRVHACHCISLSLLHACDTLCPHTFHRPPGAVSLPVRVNLPSELGGGFTLVMCFLRGGQTVRDFITRLIGMMQTTTAAVLLPESYGLTPRGASDGERDEEGRDASGAPPVFLKPDSLLADAFQEEAELELDLRRLRPLTQAQAAEVAATAQAATEDAAAATESTPSGSSSRGLPSFAVPPLPTPPAHSVLHHTCLSKLKRLRPPADAPPEVLVVSTLVPPCALPAHLAESLPHDMRTVALASALQARESSAAALAAASSSAAVAAASSSVAASVPSESDSSALRKERARLARKLDEYAAHVFDRLLARGIGEDPHITLQMAAAVVHPRSQQGERLGTGAHAAPSTMWGGWDAVVIKPPDAHVHEVPLLFVSTKKMPTPLPKKFDVTTDCLVVTNRRIVQVEDGAITNTLPFGADSGLILRLPKETDDGEEGRCPIHVLVRDAAEGAREAEAARARAQAEAEAESEEDEDEEGDGRSDKNGASDDSPRISRRARRRSMEEQRRLPSRRVTFYVPNPDIAGFLEEYLMYAQEKSSLEAHLGLLEQARLDRIAHYRTDRCLRGWTYLLKGIAGPLLFGPLRQPVYETAIKQVLAQVQQMDLKTVKLTSLRLAEFALPTLDSSPAALHANGDQLPSLRLVDYAGHPHHTYVFDLHWSAPSFYIKVEISGKKLVSFQLAVEMRGVEVRGTLRLRSSPYEPEKAAVSFVSLPHLSFGVGSHVVVGSVKLPFQRAIEKIIYQHIQAAIEGALRDKIVGDRWQSIYVEKNGLTTQLDRSATRTRELGM